MAFDTLGVNVVANGIRGVAGDIGHLALSFLRYVRAVQQADSASIKTAQSQSKLADTMSGRAQANVDRLERRWYRLTATANTLNTTIRVLQMTMKNPVAVESNYTKATQDLERQKAVVEQLKIAYQQLIATRQTSVAAALAPYIAKEEESLKKLSVTYGVAQREYVKSLQDQNRLKNSTQALIGVNKELATVTSQIPDAQQHAAEMATQAAQKQQQWADTVAAASSQTGIFGRVLSDLSGGFAGALAGNSAFLSGIGITVPQLGAMMVAMDAVKVGMRVAQMAFNGFAAVVRTVCNVLKKLVGIVWDVAQAIGKTLWNALTKVISAPLRIASSLFGNFGGSLQRVFEMAIGMNMSRVWWALGMKIRDMAKTASEAAMEYQVTFTRLSTLMKNEYVGKLGVNATAEEFSNAIAQASLATQDLIKWTSKLAVATIFGAEDILNVYTLAMSYGFASAQAEKLTESVLDFASGMGLGDTEMRRVIENFGQMRAQGKITGTELRDLARGSFVPVNDVLEKMAKNVGLVGDYDIQNLQDITASLKEMADSGEITNDTFTAMSTILEKLGADGKITRSEFDMLVQDLSKNDIMQRFGLTAEQAGKALEGIKTGQLTADLNQLIKTGKITIDEFFDAFIELAEDKYPNAAQSMGLTMKAVKSNVEDYIATMIGWRLIAPVFEVVAKHVQHFIQNTLMTEEQITRFDKMGLAFKTVTELVYSYLDAIKRTGGIFGKFSSTAFKQVGKVFTEFIDIIGKLGTKDFNAENVINFADMLKSFGMSEQSSKTISVGIQTLNNIMKNIMEGVEVDPSIFKKALDDVFGTIWKDFFGPKIKEGIETAWKNNIVPAINKLWGNMKEKFSEWKTDELMPWIKTFFGKTLPGWISAFGVWIKEKGPDIVLWVGEFVYDILAEFLKITAFKFGENSPLTRLIEVLKELFVYASFKIADPTSEINSTNAQNLATSLDNLYLSIKNIVTQSAPFQTFLDFIGSDSFQKPAEHIYNLVRIVGSLFTVLTSPISLPENEGLPAVIDWLLGSVETLAAQLLQDASLLTHAVSMIIVPIDALIELFKAFPQVNFEDSAPWEWVGQFWDAFKIGLEDSAGIKMWRDSVDGFYEASELLAGMDPYRATQNVDALVGAINNWSNLSPLPTIDLNQPFNLTGTIDSSGLPNGVTYTPGTGWSFSGGTSGQQQTVKPVEFTQPFTVNGELNFKNLPPGYKYNKETGLLEFEPIIADWTKKTLPIKTLTQPIVINGQTYYNLPPGFYVNPITNQVEYTTANGEIEADPIKVKQKLDLYVELLSKKGWSIDPYTGQLVYNPPKNTITWMFDSKLGIVVTAELIMSGNAPEGFYIDENGNVAYAPPAAKITEPDPVTVPFPVNIIPQPALPNGTPLNGADWLDDLFNFETVGPNPTAGPFSVDVEIKPTTDAKEKGGNLAIDFADGFNTTISTEMGEVDIPIPEITVERRRKATTSATAMVTEIAAVFSSDTTVASAGSAMMDALVTGISSKSRFVYKAAAELAAGLAGPLSGLSGTFAAAGTNAVQGLWNGMASVMSKLILWWIKEVGRLNSIVPTLNQQNSPSRLYRGYGEDMMKGLQLGLESGQVGAVSQMHDAAIELRQALGSINTGTISPQQYSNVSNTTNWNVNVTTPLVASTPIQAYEILRMRAR